MDNICHTTSKKEMCRPLHDHHRLYCAYNFITLHTVSDHKPFFFEDLEIFSVAVNNTFWETRCWNIKSITNLYYKIKVIIKSPHFRYKGTAEARVTPHICCLTKRKSIVIMRSAVYLCQTPPRHDEEGREG